MGYPYPNFAYVLFVGPYSVPRSPAWRAHIQNSRYLKKGAGYEPIGSAEP